MYTVKSNRLRQHARQGLLICAAMVFATSVGAGPQTKPAGSGAATLPPVTVYKGVSCGCCSKWVEHMAAAGFAVKALDVEDIEVPMKAYGVPAAAGSCHTALVGGYVVEGHVPADAVKRMLKEKPAIAGIAVPGMPVGSPGMEVPGYKDAYSVVAFDKTGKITVYERR